MHNACTNFSGRTGEPTSNLTLITDSKVILSEQSTLNIFHSDLCVNFEQQIREITLKTLKNRSK